MVPGLLGFSWHGVPLERGEGTGLCVWWGGGVVARDACSITMGGAGNASAPFFQDPQTGSQAHRRFGILCSLAFCGPTNSSLKHDQLL